jgi:hypothetical protein
MLFVFISCEAAFCGECCNLAGMGHVCQGTRALVCSCMFNETSTLSCSVLACKSAPSLSRVPTFELKSLPSRA